MSLSTNESTIPMVVHCKYDELVPIHELIGKFHPKNRNIHEKSDVEDMAKRLAYQGIREACRVCNQSGLMQNSHKRVMAAELNGWTHYPVVYQDYQDGVMEYSDLVGDNAEGKKSKIDLAGVNKDILELGPFNLDLLGLPDFVVEPAEIPKTKEKEEKKCPHCGEVL